MSLPGRTLDARHARAILKRWRGSELRKMKNFDRAATIEMVDGRVYYSTDGWHTVYLVKNGKARKLTDKEADLARFLAISEGN